MRYHRIAIVLILVACAGISLSQASHDHQTNEQRLGLKRLVKLPAILDFEQFQQLYHKHYPSLMVRMARAKLFAANALRAFISGVKYIWRKSTKYLVVNRWSDSTVEERRKMYNYGVERQVNERKDSPAANLADVKQTLEEIVEHQNENELYAEIAADLEDSGIGDGKGDRRKKRDTQTREQLEDSERQLLSLDDLVRKPDYVNKAEEKSPQSLSEEEAKEIVQESSDGLLNKVFRTVNDYLAANIEVPKPIKNVWFDNFGNKWIERSYKISKKLPNQVFLDYNESGCLPPIEDQADCGCCYVTSSTAVFEYNYCNQTKSLERFSKQFAIDCGLQLRNANPEMDYRLNGCNGGREYSVSDFYGIYGIKLETNYPFQGADGTCPVPPESSSKNIYADIIVEEAEWISKDPKSMTLDGMRALLVSKGPITISIYSYDEFGFYGGGVDLLESCNPNSGHAMVLVGDGIEDGLEYWLIRNSHGDSWGSNGHWKLAKSTNNCITELGYAELKFHIKEDLVQDKSDELYKTTNQA